RLNLPAVPAMGCKAAPITRLYRPVALSAPVIACLAICHPRFMPARSGPIMEPFSPNDFAELVLVERKASVERNTLETQVKCSINLVASGKALFDIGVPFLEHMLE